MKGIDDPRVENVPVLRIAHDRAYSVVNPHKAASGKDPKSFTNDCTADTELFAHGWFCGQRFAGGYLYPARCGPCIQ